MEKKMESQRGNEKLELYQGDFEFNAFRSHKLCAGDF